MLDVILSGCTLGDGAIEELVLEFFRGGMVGGGGCGRGFGNRYGEGDNDEVSTLDLDVEEEVVLLVGDGECEDVRGCGFGDNNGDTGVGK